MHKFRRDKQQQQSPAGASRQEAMYFAAAVHPSTASENIYLHEAI
jgi:hypothetical protein